MRGATSTSFPARRLSRRTPRRFIQLELILSTEDPAVAPVLHALALDFEDALVAQAAGQDYAASCCHLTRRRGLRMCCGRVRPKATRAFDRLRFSTPSAVDAADVRLRIGGAEREPSAVWVVGDSLLFVDLPEVVRTDSVAVEFTTKVLRNATVFAADLGQEARPDLWQSVEAAERQANLVFLPDLPGSERLIGDLADCAVGIFAQRRWDQRPRADSLCAVQGGWMPLQACAFST